MVNMFQSSSVYSLYSIASICASSMQSQQLTEYFAGCEVATSYITCIAFSFSSSLAMNRASESKSRFKSCVFFKLNKLLLHRKKHKTFQLLAALELQQKYKN